MIGILKDASDLHTDPAHGRPLPKGRPLHAILSRILDRQRLAVLDWVRSLREIPRHAPSLARWTEPMATATALPIESYRRQGARQLLGEILRALASRRSTQRGHTPARRKSPAEPTTVEQILADAFRVFNAEVAEAARHAAFAFCQATNQTATNVLALAVRDARNDLADGLEKGEALARLTARVQRSFGDPLRAARIAATEASRAVHAGQQQVALATGGLVSRKTWMASSDACELCLSLNGLSVPVNQHFVVAGGSGPYAVVEHPPGHPHCMCALTFEVDL